MRSLGVKSGLTAFPRFQAPVQDSSPALKIAMQELRWRPCLHWDITRTWINSLRSLRFKSLGRGSHDILLYTGHLLAYIRKCSACPREIGRHSTLVCASCLISLYPYLLSLSIIRPKSTCLGLPGGFIVVVFIALDIDGEVIFRFLPSAVSRKHHLHRCSPLSVLLAPCHWTLAYPVTRA